MTDNIPDNQQLLAELATLNVERGRELQLLNRASQAITSSLDRDKVLTTLLEEVRELLDITSCSVWLVDSVTQELVCQQMTDQTEVPQDWRLAPGQGLVGWVAQHQETLLIPDAQTDDRHYRGIDQQTGIVLRSILSVPLQVNQQVVGVLQAVDTQINRFDEVNLTLLEALANQAAIAIHNAQLYERAQQEIEERRRAQEHIQNTLKEKEILLKEIHHRVKNNLQVVSSLLSLQSEATADVGCRRIFRECENRIKSMAIIHDQLYQSKDLSQVDLAVYIPNLVAHLIRSYNIDQARIALKITVDHILLHIDKATPCGLIINELTSNAFKYAFPENRQGKIHLSITLADDMVSLVVSDSGVGLPTELDTTEPQSLGLQLVYLLIDQLGGSLSHENERGTTFRLLFPV